MPNILRVVKFIFTNVRVVRVKVIEHLYSALLWNEPVDRDARNSKRVTVYLTPTHKSYLPLLPSRRASPPFGWYSLHLPTEGWSG